MSPEELQTLLSSADGDELLSQADKLAEISNQLKEQGKKRKEEEKRKLNERLTELGIDSVAKLENRLSQEPEVKTETKTVVKEVPVKDPRLDMLEEAGMTETAMRGVLYPSEQQINGNGQGTALIIDHDQIKAASQLTSGEIAYIAYPLAHGNWLLATADNQAAVKQRVEQVAAANQQSKSAVDTPISQSKEKQSATPKKRPTKTTKKGKAVDLDDIDIKDSVLNAYNNL